MSGQKAPSTRKCIKTPVENMSIFWPTRVRKHPAPQGALIHLSKHAERLVLSGQKAPSTRSAYSRGLPCGGCQQRRKTASPTASPLNRPSESPRTIPPPRAPSSSTTTKASTPGGFVPGELAGFQQASRSRNRLHRRERPADAKPGGRAKRSPAARSSPTHGTQSTRRRTNIHVPHQHCFSGDAEAGP